MDRLSPTVYFSAKEGVIKTKSATIVFFLFSSFFLHPGSFFFSFS